MDSYLCQFGSNRIRRLAYTLQKTSRLRLGNHSGDRVKLGNWHRPLGS